MHTALHTCTVPFVIKRLRMTSHVLMKYLPIKCQTKMYYQAPKYSLAFNYGYRKPQWNLSWNLQISSGDFRSVACNTMKLYIVSDGYTNCTNLKVACSERCSSFSYFTYINLGWRKLPLTGYGPSFLPLVEKLPVNSAAGVGLSKFCTFSLSTIGFLDSKEK